ncbi:MAG: ABC transporter permease [Acidimicrobiales bacterium]|nr:ABC transporter permease [Acidimicrobiales bacterium]
MSAEPASERAPGRPPVAPTVRSVSVFPAIYRVLLTSQVTLARVLALGALGVAAILVAWAIGQSDPVDATATGARFVNVFGLSLTVPVTALVFASAALGDLTDDGTLVYLWLRPVRRATVVLAAFAAALTVTIPLVVVPLVIAASLTGGGADLVKGTALAAALGAVAYAGLFTALGLRVRRALIWGLLYIFIWEGFVARGGDNAARLAVRSVTATILQAWSGTELRLGVLATGTAYLAPFVVAALALGYATWRLDRQDVD